ncbi:MAG: hypothetical protein RL376_290 [Verrucomicrobiota bacterium]
MMAATVATMSHPPSTSAFPCARRLPTLRFFPPMNTKPQVLSWLLCDGVHIDPATGKHTILGVFSAIRGRQFPLTHPFMIWFLTLTNVAAGEHKIKISLGLSPESMSVLLDRAFQSQGPLQRINLINDVRNLAFPAPGDYAITIEVNDELLLATSLTVAN